MSLVKVMDLAIGIAGELDERNEKIPEGVFFLYDSTIHEFLEQISCKVKRIYAYVCTKVSNKLKVF